MANMKHLVRLCLGVKVWNQWKRKNPSIDCDLRKAYLNKRNLSGVNISGFDFSRANFSGADLSKTQVLGTNFTAAIFTEACIEDWNINSTTNLTGVICDYIYLRQNQQERRPSDIKKNFAPGEFTKLFQKVQETVDLIFADGIDWKAFLFSFQELQDKYGKENLSVQAIEKKSGGAFIIRLEVPPEANKAEIESQAKTLYENELKKLEAWYSKKLQAKDKQIRRYRKKNANLIEIIKFQASRPIENIINVTAKAESNSMSESYQSKYDQRNSNNQFIDTAQLGSKPTLNQYNYTEEQRKNLADAAAEIQQLLDQLAQSNPTTAEVAVIEVIHHEIRHNPTLKARLLEALKAGGLEALKQIFNHPLFSIPAETVRGWLEAE